MSTKRVSLQRIVAVCLMVAFCTATGGTSGYLLARAFILNHAKLRVGDSAGRAAGELSASIIESRKALREMSGLGGERCSPEDLDRLRSLVFQSHYLKEAGRILDGRIACSTTYGSRIASAALPRPDVVLKDGSRLYRNLPLFQIHGNALIAVESGGSFVVHNPFSQSELNATNMQVAVASADEMASGRGPLMGQTAPPRDIPLTRDAGGIADGQIFATRCTSSSGPCVAVYIPAQEVLDGSFAVLATLAGFGALVGGLAGVVGSQLYVRKRSLPAQLLKAIHDDRLTVVYQPIVDLGTGRIVEAEALVRWSDDHGAPVSPDVFVALAEEQGFVGDITRLVVRRVLDELGSLLRAFPGFRISVNVAAPDLADPVFLPMLEEALETSGVSPESLGIEITESFTARLQVAKDTINRLRARGHHVAIDDFGTGYSSLAYLYDLSVDAIKIDKAFTRAIGTNAVTVSILPQILSMAEQLGLRVTVEGIETVQQARYFADAPVPVHAQGWLYGRPVPCSAFLTVLEADRTAPPTSGVRHGSIPVAQPVR